MQFGADPQPGLTVSYGIRESAIVVQVQGELDYHSAPVLRSALAQVWDVPGISAIVLDLADVTFCDSVGLSELIAALRGSQITGHALMVSGVHGTLLRVLTITGLRNAFDSYETVEDALTHAPRPLEPPADTPSILEPEGLPSSPLDPPLGAPSVLEPPAPAPSPLADGT
jgi:anti-sigma B factor antagonist